MKVISGTSNLPLSQDIAKQLDIPLGDAEITRFIDNECRVYVREEVEGEDVYVVQSLSKVADQHVVELCLIGQALKDLGAKRVTAVIPWMGYSKQDKAFRKGEAVSAQLVARFIESAGFDNVIAVELHSENVLPYFFVPVTEISTHKLLADALPSGILYEGAVVVSPDKGGKSRSERFAKETRFDVAYLEKNRDVTSGAVSVVGIDGDVSGKTVVIFDDIINTGATAIKTSSFVKSKGARAVIFLATHAVFAGNASEELSKSIIDRVIVTDTIRISKEKSFEKLSVIGVASLLAEAIKKQI